jgi:nicotinamidase-related amidase
VLDQFRKIAAPIFHIQHISTRPAATFFLPNTIGAEIHESVKPLGGEQIVVKNYPNSFRETELHDILKQQNIELIVICGAMSHMCIDTTTRAAFDLGYKSIVISDACATKELLYNDIKVPAEHVHAAYMAGLNGMFASVNKWGDVELT